MRDSAPISAHRDDVVERVREASDIVALVDAYVPLRRRGRRFEALCPFHEEKTPSFSVNPDLQIFKCFGCGKGGDAFTFVEEFERVSFREALEMLAERAGVALRSRGFGGGEEGKGPLREALRLAWERYRAHLWGPAGAAARAYLSFRGLAEETCREWGLGYAVEAWDDLLSFARSKGVAEPTLERAGLALRSSEGRLYDRFRGRLLFPIVDGLGRPVGFGGRVLGEGEPKYLNSPETALFSKGRCLYGLDRARTATGDGGALVVVEGYTDVLHCHQAGVRNVVATLGTALTPEHSRALRRYTRDVVLVFDGDAAGARASERGVETLLAEDLGVRVASMSAGEDPADFVRERGGEAFRRAIEEAPDFFDDAIARMERSGSMATPTGRNRAADALLGTVSRVASPVARTELLLRIARRLLVPEADLRRRLEGLETAERRPRARAEAASARSSRTPDRVAEEQVLACCLQDPGAFAAVRHVLTADDFGEEDLREVYRTLLGLDGRGAEVSAGGALLALAGRPCRAAVAGLAASSIERPAATLKGALAFLGRRRAARRVAEGTEEWRRARGASGDEAERQALQELHRRMREAKSLGSRSA